MKIIFLCNEYPPVLHGGTGSFVKSMAEYLAPLHDIIVIGAYSDVRKLTVYRENKVTVHKIPMKPEKSKWVFLINRLNLSIYVNRVIKENRIDIVEAFDTNAWFLFLKKKPPVFVRLHNGERYTTKQRGSFVKLVEGLSFSRRDSYIAVSKAIRKEFLFFFNLKSKHYDRYTKVIYNGIHLDQFPVIPAGSYDRNKIVFVGTLKKVKGVNVLIEVFLRLRKSIPELYLSIIGGDTHEMGGYKNYLIDHFGIHEMVNTGVVTFHGRMNRQEINEQLRSALVCVVPSIFESFGLVTIEAMACFVPVICTRVGANPEIIDSGVNGFIIDSGDVNQLGILIQELYEGKYNRELLILRARKDVEKHFSIQFCAQQTLRFYEERLQ